MVAGISQWRSSSNAMAVNFARGVITGWAPIFTMVQTLPHGLRTSLHSRGHLAPQP